MSSPLSTRALPLALTGIVAGALGTIPLSRLPRSVRIGYVVIPGALTAGATYLALRSARGGGPQRPRLHAAGWAVALGASSIGAAAGGLWVDRVIEDALRARGVPVPRLVMGVTSGAVMAVLTAVDLHRHDGGGVGTEAAPVLPAWTAIPSFRVCGPPAPRHPSVHGEVR